MREATCTCGKIVPSNPQLAFFEDRSAGHTDDYCRHCRYAPIAHTKKAETDAPHLRNVCDNFEPLSEGMPYDLYYCGHGGWD